MVKSVFTRNRILIFAVLVSLAWHVLWLSTIKIVAPTVREPVKFSKVAFLGPILDRGVMEVRVGQRERSFLENRYLSLMQSVSELKNHVQGGKFTETRSSRSLNEKLIYLIDEAASGPKIEPPSDIL